MTYITKFTTDFLIVPNTNIETKYETVTNSSILLGVSKSIFVLLLFTCFNMSSVIGYFCGFFSTQMTGEIFRSVIRSNY